LINKEPLMGLVGSVGIIKRGSSSPAKPIFESAVPLSITMGFE